MYCFVYTATEEPLVSVESVHTDQQAAIDRLIELYIMDQSRHLRLTRTDELKDQARKHMAEFQAHHHPLDCAIARLPISCGHYRVVKVETGWPPLRCDQSDDEGEDEDADEDEDESDEDESDEDESDEDESDEDESDEDEDEKEDEDKEDDDEKDEDEKDIPPQ